MSNSKISALTSATTPLAGTETLPIVQSSATTKVTVANLTAGRSVAAGNYSATSNVYFNTAYSSSVAAYIYCDNTATTGAILNIRKGRDIGAGPVEGVGLDCLNGALSAVVPGIIRGNPFLINDGTASTTYQNGNITVGAGNVVQGTAAKGFDFSANTPLAGKTSTVLGWYEEGTWTPNQGAGLTLVGAFSSTGKYTRIGRQVSISGTVTGATSVAVTAAGVITSNLPFTVVTAGHGDATNAAVTASAAVICTSTSVTSAAAIAATGTITFSATYFV